MILNTPGTLQPIIQDFKNYTEVVEKYKNSPASFVLVFVQKQDDIQRNLDLIKDQLIEDCIVWFAYPKKSSKQYKSDINRDQGWQPLGDAGYEGVRQIAIDDDWSALRFRKAKYIKQIKRDSSRMMSKE